MRIAHLVEQGEIDNTTPGRIRGVLRLYGSDQPLRLELEGNCLPDLAGRRCSFVNHNPLHDPVWSSLAPRQTGIAGDMTASRKVRVPSVPVGDYLRLRQAGKRPPESWANCLYIEWYSEANGRVVVESTDFDLTISLPTWVLDPADEARQRHVSMEAFATWLERLKEAAGAREALVVPPDRPMDEFEWERFLREADACGERYGELVDKYLDHPDRDRIIAREMGWTQLEKALDELGAGRVEDLPAPLDDALDEGNAKPEPDPARQGVDWVPDGHGGVCHPLAKASFDLACRMGRMVDTERVAEAEARGEEDREIAEMLACTRLVSVKLAGALNGIATGYGPMEPGFIVASLKRALGPLGRALNALQNVENRELMKQPVDAFRDELFRIRAGVLDIQEQHRARLRGDG